MTLTEYVNNENNYMNYDFSNEKANENYKKLGGFDKFFIYMARDRKDIIAKYGNIIDPDSNSDLLQKVYIKLWKAEAINLCRDRSNRIKGDTMNTINTVFAEFYEKCTGKKSSRVTRSNMYFEQGIKFLNIEDKNEYIDLEKLTSVYHMLGNYIICPVGCNPPRGFNNKKICDFWDLTLASIYNYYPENKNKIFYDNFKIEYDISHIVNGKCELEKKYKQWLDTFKTWKGFIEENYMQDWIYDNEEGKDGKPTELWTGHFKNGPMPIDKEQYRSYFINAEKLILKRGKRMFEELKRK